MSEPTSKQWWFLVCALLVLTTFFIYSPVRNHSFVKYDDDKYVTENPNVNTGLSLKNIKWAFTTNYASNWHPLTWLSHMLDCEIFGLNAGLHHLVNLAIHIANTLLLFIIFNRMTRKFWPSAFIAALFAIHPLHVESVAWVAERKDVLSTLFWLLTMWAYAEYVRKPKVTKYLLTFSFFALGLMTKPMLVTLPVVLLILDYWPLQRTKQFKRVALEKLPFFILSAVSCVVTFLVQRSGGAVVAIESFNLKIRFANATISYIRYIEKMFWPVKLAVLYPHPGANVSIVKAAICAAAILSLTACFIYIGRKRKYFLAGWLWYLVTLVPVIGLVQVGAQSMADRYTYIPLLGLFIIIAFAAGELTGQLRIRKTIVTGLAVTTIVILSVLTRQQLKYWSDSEALFAHTLNVTKNNHVMYNNYGAFLKETNRPDLAIEQFAKALKLRPNSSEVHTNLGNALAAAGRFEDAIAHHKTAIELSPFAPEAHYNLAVVLSKTGKGDQAIHEYQKALDVTPNNCDALTNIGFLFAQKGKTVKAIEYYKNALQCRPGDIITHGRLGLALAQKGDAEQAVTHFQTVLKARPKDVEMHCNIGILLQQLGRKPEAIEHYNKAIQIDPANKKALELFQKALKTNSND